MKSMCVSDSLTPSAAGSPSRPVDRPRQPAAPGDVGGRVLVEERVVEDDPGLADARGVVDQRDLAEPAGALVERDLGPHELLALLGPRLDDLAAGQPQLEPLDQAAAQRQRRAERTVPSARSRWGVVKTSSVGRFGTCCLAALGALARRDPAPALDQADLEVGPRPAVAQGREAALGELRAPARRARSSRSSHAAAGSGASSRSECATASHSRPTSGSPKTSRAHSSVG